MGDWTYYYSYSPRIQQKDSWAYSLKIGLNKAVIFVLNIKTHTLRSWLEMHFKC